MDLWRNEEMQKWADKYSIKELEEAYLAGLGKTGSGYGRRCARFPSDGILLLHAHPPHR